MVYDIIKKNKELLEELKSKLRMTRCSIKGADHYRGGGVVFIENSNWCEVEPDYSIFKKNLHLNPRINEIWVKNNGDGRPTVLFIYNDGLLSHNCGEYPFFFIKFIDLIGD